MRRIFLLVMCGIFLAGSGVYTQVQTDINNIRFERKTFVKNSNKADVELSYPVFTGQEKPVLADSLNNIVNKFMGFLSYSEKKKKYVTATHMDIFKEYDVDMEGFYAGMKNELERRVEVMLNDYGIITLEFIQYSFTGGAHGNSGLLYTVYDLKGEKRIKLSDLFNKGFMSKLTEIGELWFREARGLEQTKNLEEEGYWFEKNKFALNDNFFISRDGLGFTYNQYEIAPYVLGISTFVIPFRELKEIISKNSVLRRFIPGN